MNQYLNYLGIFDVGQVYYQSSQAKLVEEAIKKGEGKLSYTGALVVKTGIYTGRSPNDRFFVDTPLIHNKINWNKTNVAISEEKFNKIYEKVKNYLKSKEVYIFDGFACADPEYALSIRFITELASQNLFVQDMFLHPSPESLSKFVPGFTVISVPGLKLDPKIDDTNSEAAILVNIEKKIILVIASQYAGEIKKSIFTTLNYILPEINIFPMHCSANVGFNGKSALFFGLSGTGKTTLSADPNRMIVGDDEHGWSDKGIFNFEGGCYAKCINLSKKNEPQIWDAIKFGAMVENVTMFPDSRTLNFDDASITENTRAGYPISHIPNAVTSGMANHPEIIVFLTADAYGVLPPVAKLTKEQAQYHFISGYTSKLAGTERGIIEPQATFSNCFGGPFMPLLSAKYAELLIEKIKKYNTKVYLINTGWIGGTFGVGERISIPYTRAIINAALSGELENVEYELHPVFNLLMPKSCSEVPVEILNPKQTWKDKEAYDEAADKLANMFIENFKKFSGVDHLVAAGPKSKIFK
ncbi:MAG: phosphoenolpyruvate carboxykinase (ATP) [bacterium]